MYLATMVSPGGLKSDVAVKLLRDASPDALRRLRDEGKLLAALNHPAILRAHDLAGLDGNVALVTEFVDGADLTELTHGVRAMPPRAVLEVSAVVAEALYVAFTTVPPDGAAPLRLVHRDVKPSNIRIGRHGEVKLLDFGIAWASVAGREAQTNASAMMGSLPYMAPERFARSPARHESDVYALGCTMFEALAGRRLFPDATPVDMARLAADAGAHDAHVAEAFGELPPDAQLAVELLTEMLHYEPERRPPAEQVAARCEELADEAAGARLKSWVRAFDWGEQRDGGPLSGKTLTEQTLSAMSGWQTDGDALPLADRTLDLGQSASWEAQTFDIGAEVDPPPSAPASGARPGLQVLAVVMLALFMGLGMWWSQSGTAEIEVPATPQLRPQPAPAVTEPVVETPAPEPAAPEPIVPEPASEPAPVAVPAPLAKPRPTPKPAPVPVPEVVEPPAPEPPAPVPEPAPPEPVAMGTVFGFPEVDIVLRDRNGKQFAPGEVPVGRYELLADFGEGLTPVGSTQVLAGGVGRIRCNKLLQTCEVQ